MSAGELAVRDQVAARALGAQRSAGDSTDYGLDVISISARPLNREMTDFIAYEKVRFRDSGAARNLIELYRRDGASAPWRATDRVYIADNIDLPALKRDSKGDAGLLSGGDARAQDGPRPQELAQRYAAVVSVPAGPGRLPAGTFQPGQYTSGEITDATDAAGLVC